MSKSRSDHDSENSKRWSRLAQTPLLDQQEEIELTKLAQSGDLDARQKLVNANVRLVINIARTYPTRSTPLDDLVQEGIIGLMTAVDRFDPTRGFRLSTYASHWIRQAIGCALDSKSKTIRLPAHISQAIRKIDRIRAEIVEETGQSATLEQMAERMGMNVNRLQAIIDCSQELLSLDVPMYGSENSTLSSSIHDERAGNPEAMVLNSEIIEELNALLSSLTDRERKVVTNSYRQQEGDSSDDMAVELNLSKERIRQIEVQAIRKLRVLAQRHRFKEYFSD